MRDPISHFKRAVSMKNLRILLGLIPLVVATCPVSVLGQNGATSGNSSVSGHSNSTGQARQDATQLADLDLEQLANLKINVTSASKKSESLFQAPAAIAVLTEEDIRRGGFSTLAEALRMVPGLYVAQANSHIWQISARGFSSRNNNKMLVLVDGRSAYTPELGSVYWDVLDIPLENVERIEVIRGPGGTLWGANAVNGVISILSKSARDTQGGLIYGGGGDVHLALGGCTGDNAELVWIDVGVSQDGFLVVQTPPGVVVVIGGDAD